MNYTYTFMVWPEKQDSALLLLFGLLNPVEMEFTEAAFAEFRRSLLREGFSLRGIARRPCGEPEAVA